jgi:hypothetical protein
MLKKALLSAGLIAAAGMLGAGAAQANASTQTFSGYYPSGSPGSYSSTVVFTFDATNNDITVNIQNTTSSVFNIGQAISGISFSLANLGSGSLSVDPNAPVGYEGDSSASGSLLSNSQLNNPWEIADSSGTFALGNPKILGSVGGLGLSAGKTYPKGSPTDLVVETISNPNGSIGAHSPSLFGQVNSTTGAQEGVTFTLDAATSAITADTAVTGNVTVYFGTGPDLYVSDYVPGTQQPVPAGGPLPVPATLPLVGGGIGGLALLALRKRRQLL